MRITEMEENPLTPFQERVVAEKIELGLKATKLAMFINTGTFNDLPEDEQDRLKRQLKIMDDYCQVLDERIAAFIPASNAIAYAKE